MDPCEDAVKAPSAVQESLASRVDSLEGGMKDVSNQIKNLEGAVKSSKSGIEELKEEISKLSETVKDLMAVYEVVSREYNPFVEVENEKTKTHFGPAGCSTLKGISIIPSPSEGTSFKDLGGTKKLEPVDKVVRPESDVEMFLLNMPGDECNKGRNESTVNVERRMKSLEGAGNVGKPSSPTIDFKDAAYMLQMMKLVEFQLEKIFISRVECGRIDTDDVMRLDYYLKEFKRAGMV
ncbi:MAG: flagella accessory protein C [Methanomassiliicoccales archaeon]